MCTRQSHGILQSLASKQNVTFRSNSIKTQHEDILEAQILEFAEWVNNVEGALKRIKLPVKGMASEQ